MRTAYREKRYYCGEYLDVYIFPVFETGRRASGRGKKRKPTSSAQKKLNQRHREQKLARLLHSNFTPDDLELNLSYTVQPESDEEAARLLRNYIGKSRLPANRSPPCSIGRSSGPGSSRRSRTRNKKSGRGLIPSPAFCLPPAAMRFS